MNLKEKSSSLPILAAYSNNCSHIRLDNWLALHEGFVEATKIMQMQKKLINPIIRSEDHTLRTFFLRYCFVRLPARLVRRTAQMVALWLNL